MTLGRNTVESILVALVVGTGVKKVLGYTKYLCASSLLRFCNHRTLQNTGV